MPIIKSAIKKMRQDRARTEINLAKRAALKKVLKVTTKNLGEKQLSQAFSALDKAAKKGLIPKGRADRQKARLAKKLSATSEKTTTAKKKVAKKKA